MLLTSNSFLFYFLPISLISFSVLKLKKKNRIYFLGVLSGYLYMLDNGQLVVVLIFLSLLIKLQLETKIFNNFIFIFIILSPLILFKYLQPILLFFGLSIPELIISNFPIGLSFFTFQGIAYYFDSERNGQKETTFDIFTFLTFFPQLLAGPIVPIKSFREGISNTNITYEDTLYGVHRFSVGLIKKFLIADSLSEISKIYIESNQSFDLTIYSGLIIILTYTFQIYFDFSAYCDIAIGIGRLFGFRLPENFNNPYHAKSFKDFWSRWHITLSNFFKVHIYIPLGGNRVSKFKMYRNLWITFLCTALWHGSTFTFILWGFLHGLFLTLEKVINYKSIFSNRFITFLLISLSWVPFFSENISSTINIYLSLTNYQLLNDNFLPLFAQALDFKLLIAYVVCISSLLVKKEFYYPNLIYVFITLILAILLVMSSTVDPFIYYRF